MSLFVVPDLLAAAAGDLAVIEQALSAGNAAAAVPTARVTAAAADEVSEAIAALFGAYAQQYQVISAQAMTFHHRLVLSWARAREASHSLKRPTRRPCNRSGRLC